MQATVAGTITRCSEFGEYRTWKLRRLISSWLRRYLVGKQAARYQESLPISLFWEHKDGNDHCHFAMATDHVLGFAATDTTCLQMQGKLQSWLKKKSIMLKADVLIEPVRNDERWKSYITKFVNSSSFFEPRGLGGAPKAVPLAKHPVITTNVEESSAPFSQEITQGQYERYHQSLIRVPRRALAHLKHVGSDAVIKRIRLQDAVQRQSQPTNGLIKSMQGVIK